MYILRIPARYMSATASDGEKEIYAHYKLMLEECCNGKREGIILPSEVDPESRQPYFSLECITDTNKL